MASTQICTAVLKPNVSSVPDRSLSMVLGTPTTGSPSPDKPVGTVWIGWKRRGGYGHAQQFHFPGDREAVRRQTVAAALIGLRRTLTE